MTGPLHVVSGDGAARHVEMLGLEGEVLVWREALATGPVAARPWGDEFWAARAAFLVKPASLVSDQHRALTTALSTRAAICLWFGRDVFCQLVLAGLVAALDGQGHDVSRLLLVVPDGAPRCLDDTDDALRSWYADRRPITSADGAGISALWRAYAGSDPRDLVAATEIAPTSPVMAPVIEGLRRHLGRFPDPDGLGVDEREILATLGAAGGALSFGELFTGFTRTRPDYGWADLQVAGLIEGLTALGEPALALSTPSVEPATRVRLTRRGIAAMEGQRDLRSDGNDVARALGGVTIGPGQPDWRWDDNTMTAA